MSQHQEENPKMSLVVQPTADSQPVDPAEFTRVLRSLTLKMRTANGEEIEVPLSEIAMGSTVYEIPRQTQTSDRRHAAAGAKYAKCGNCGEKIPMTDDPAENHHAAQRHKFNCAKQEQAAAEHVKLLEEHPQFRNLPPAPAALQIAAAPSPKRMPRSWWRFFR